MDAPLKTQAEKLAREMAAQVTTLDDLNGLMRSMMKTALERMLNTEMDVHLGRRTAAGVAEEAEPLSRMQRVRRRLPCRRGIVATDILKRPSAVIWANSRCRRPAIVTVRSSRS